MSRSWASVVTRALRFMRPVGCTAIFSEMPLETAYGGEMNIQCHSCEVGSIVSAKKVLTIKHLDRFVNNI